MQQRSVEDILLDLAPQSDAKEIEGSFFEKHQNILDTLSILAFVNVLLIIYQNGGLKVVSNFKYFKSKEKNNQEYQQLFERALRNSELVTMEIPNITTNQLLLAAIEPQLYVVQTRSRSLFPFSHCLHKWCQQQFSSNKDLVGFRITHYVVTLEQIPIANDCLKKWENVCSEKANRIYAMDLVQMYFSWCLRTYKQQRILRDIIVAMAQLSCGKTSIAAIEVTMHCFRRTITHYMRMIATYFVFHKELKYVYAYNKEEEERRKEKKKGILMQMG
ncbi:hypothetical protein RFI_34172 [Reticulomyxa filosa]|uniref:Uncharacterized protein n=1 Tax=Reticulomyxa filosa TaxID=46433 RepID=X6LR65_RETFI|nr:hypothetical protein RFI_34172 [Reticulomyxa filosa]|eukprot:ETO03240.1 hypothetical protein RFI_34172 [Reticulomyxa filosa]